MISELNNAGCFETYRMPRGGIEVAGTNGRTRNDFREGSVTSMTRTRLRRGVASLFTPTRSEAATLFLRVVCGSRFVDALTAHGISRGVDDPESAHVTGCPSHAAKKRIGWRKRAVP
jgi:hypothetical protein